MSRETNILRGITNQDLKDMVRKALNNGFILGEMTGTTHCSVVWPPTRERVGFGTTVSDSNYWKGFARQCEKVSGGAVTMIEKHNRTRTPHKVAKPGFITTRPSPLQERLQARVESLSREYRLLALEFRILSMGGEGASTREHINDAMDIIRRMSKLEMVLKELHQPIPEIDGMKPVTNTTTKMEEL